MTDTERPIDKLMAMSPEDRKALTAELFRQFQESEAAKKQVADDTKKAATVRRAAEKKERERLLVAVRTELTDVFDALQVSATPRTFTKKVEGPGGQELEVNNGQGYYLTGEMAMTLDDGTVRMVLAQLLFKFDDTKLRKAEIASVPTVLAGLVGDPDQV